MKKRKKKAGKKSVFPTAGFVSVLVGSPGRTVGEVGRHRDLRGGRGHQKPEEQRTAVGVCTSLEGGTELHSRAWELHREKCLLQAPAGLMQ